MAVVRLRARKVKHMKRWQFDVRDFLAVSEK